MSKFLPFSPIQISVRPALLAATLCASAFTSINILPARADSLDQFALHKATSEAKFASGKGNLLFLAAGTLLPLIQEGGREGRQQTFRTIDSTLTATLITEGLKTITKERRPDGSSRDSFPSGHATAAFAVAALQAHFHPKQALLWYGGATLIGASRVQLERHYWHDVLAGAAVGYFTTQIELRQSRGLILRPFISGSPERESWETKTAGLSLMKTF